MLTSNGDKGDETFNESTDNNWFISILCLSVGANCKSRFIKHYRSNKDYTNCFHLNNGISLRYSCDTRMDKNFRSQNKFNTCAVRTDHSSHSFSRIKNQDHLNQVFF